MPVNDNIHIQLDADVNTLFKQFKASALVAHIALTVAPLVNIHCKTDNIRVPVVTERFECTLVYEFGEPCKPVRTHSPELITLAALINKLSVLYRKLTVL